MLGWRVALSQRHFSTKHSVSTYCSVAFAQTLLRGQWTVVTHTAKLIHLLLFLLCMIIQSWFIKMIHVRCAYDVEMVWVKSFTETQVWLVTLFHHVKLLLPHCGFFTGKVWIRSHLASSWVDKVEKTHSAIGFWASQSYREEASACFPRHQEASRKWNGAETPSFRLCLL